jgi:hypothetical protein
MMLPLTDYLLLASLVLHESRIVLELPFTDFIVPNRGMFIAALQPYILPMSAQALDSIL